MVPCHFRNVMFLLLPPPFNSAIYTIQYGLLQKDDRGDCYRAPGQFTQQVKGHERLAHFGIFLLSRQLNALST